jgi:alcohol dehydrogenase class IV
MCTSQFSNRFVSAAATTGFDVLCHAFESILNPRSNVATELFAWEALRRVIYDLPTAVQEGANLAARSSMAWTDTLAGMSICRAGVALPHGIAMAVGGMFPNTPHGMALASVYRACLEFTWESAVPAFARLARILEPTLEDVDTSEAAAACPGLVDEFISGIGLAFSLKDFGISKEEIPALARQSMVLRDYRNNPGVPTYNEMLQIISACSDTPPEVGQFASRRDSLLLNVHYRTNRRVTPQRATNCGRSGICSGPRRE